MVKFFRILGICLLITSGLNFIGGFTANYVTQQSVFITLSCGTLVGGIVSLGFSCVLSKMRDMEDLLVFVSEHKDKKEDDTDNTETSQA